MGSAHLHRKVRRPARAKSAPPKAPAAAPSARPRRRAARYEFRVGANLSPVLARAAKELAGDRALAGAELGRLRRLATTDAGRMFVAGLSDAGNVRALSRMAVDPGATLDFSLDSIRAGMAQNAPRRRHPAVPRSTAQGRVVQRDLRIEEDSSIRVHGRELSHRQSVTAIPQAPLGDVEASASYIDRLADHLVLSGAESDITIAISWPAGTSHTTVPVRLGAFTRARHPYGVGDRIHASAGDAAAAARAEASQLGLDPAQAYGYYWGPEGAIFPTVFTPTTTPRIFAGFVEAVARRHEALARLLHEAGEEMVALLYDMISGRIVAVVEGAVVSRLLGLGSERAEVTSLDEVDEVGFEPLPNSATGEEPPVGPSAEGETGELAFRTRFRSRPANDVAPPEVPMAQAAGAEVSAETEVGGSQLRTSGSGAAEDEIERFEAAGRRRRGTEHTSNQQTSNRETHQRGRSRQQAQNQRADARNAEARRAASAARGRSLLSRLSMRVRNLPDRITRQLADTGTPMDVRMRILQEHVGGDVAADLREAGLTPEQLFEHLERNGAL